MTLRLSVVRSWPRRVVTAFTAAAAAVLLTATQASAVSPGHYSVSATGGATFQLLSNNNLVNGTADDVLYYLSTTGSGIHRLPFALHLYNQTYQNIAISTNGNIQPGVISPGGTAAYNNTCLPTTVTGKPLVAPFWDDLYFVSTDTSHFFTEGVFLKTSGSAPHRKFIVSWQGHRFTEGDFVLAQVIFQEGSQTVTYVYGANGGSSATVGIQSKQQLSSTEWSCQTTNNPPSPGTEVTSGMRLTWLHSG